MKPSVITRLILTLRGEWVILKCDHLLSQLWHQLQPLLAPQPVQPKPRIGFHQ